MTKSLKEIWRHNLNIHYIWTFFSSVLFLAPIITLYYKFYGMSVQDIVILSSVFTLLSTLFEIPTSTLWDTIWRVRVLKLSVLSSLLSFIIIFLFPSIYAFYIAIVFSSLWNALWSGTWHAKLQEDLEISEKENEFWKLIGRLIALQNMWKLFTPIVIYFVLRYFSNWYQILAALDVFFWFIALVFVFQFKETRELIRYSNKKHFLDSQIDTFKSWLAFLFSTKSLLVLLLLMILWNDLWYLSRVILPSLVENWVEDFLSSYIIWFSILAGILWNLIPQKLWEILSWERLFMILILFNSIFHFWAYYYSANNFILSLFFIFISFVIGIYWATWNHLVMKLTNIKQKATVRSIFLMMIWLFEALFLMIISFFSLKISLLILSISIFLWFIIWLIFLYQ